MSTSPMKAIRFFSVVLLSLCAFGQDKGSLPLPLTGNVTLPLDEYNRLIELASKPVTKIDNAPLSYSIKSVAFKIQVTGEMAIAKIQLEGETFHKGLTKVALVTGMTILDAQQRGKELPVEQAGGTHTAVLPGPAEFSITLDAGIPLNIETGRASFQLPVPPAGTARLSLTLPGDHANVSLNTGLITGRSSDNGHTTIEATLPPGKLGTIWWATREITAPVVAREVHFLSDLKTLISVTEAQLGMTSLADITVLQGEPSQFEMEIPPGYEVTSATGTSLESSEAQPGVLILRVTDPRQRSHQFLISMEKSINALKADGPIPVFRGAQRETGEVLVTGEGTMELTATESGGLKRMDLKESSTYLQALARGSLQAAFRYHKQPAGTPALGLDWVRFPDTPVLAAVAQQAVVTTLVTSEGKSLTEVKLVLKNQAQPFLKIGLPPGAAILSADVAGTKVKPVQGPGGNRVPLLRPGFRPKDSYVVSFVFMHSGTPFAKKGESELALPRMDVPISLLQWEVFLPTQYRVKGFGGDAISATLLPVVQNDVTFRDVERALTGSGTIDLDSLTAGQVGGTVMDSTGAGIPGAQVNLTASATGIAMKTTSDGRGRWMISHVPSGRLKIVVESAGFTQFKQEVTYDSIRPWQVDCTLQIGARLSP